MHGQGTYTYSSGSKYIGEYKDGNMHGKGTSTFPDGTEETGIWADNEYLYGLTEKARIDCAKEAGKANTEYAAKQIEKTCLAGMGLKP